MLLVLLVVLLGLLLLFGIVVDVGGCGVVVCLNNIPICFGHTLLYV